MPIEIMELVIKAKVTENGANASAGGQTSTDNASIKAALKPIEKSVEALTQMLKRKQER